MEMLLRDRLRELRGNRTQIQMAELLGVKPNNYNGWENGKEPNVETLIRIANYHDVTLDYLLGRVDYKHPEYRQVNMDTGLSEAAIRGVQAIRDTSTDKNNRIKAFNYLLELVNLSYDDDNIKLSHLLDIISWYDRNAYLDVLNDLSCPEFQKYLIKEIVEKGLLESDVDEVRKMLQVWQDGFRNGYDLPL